MKDSNELAQSSDEEEFVPKKLRIQRKRAFKKEKERKLLEKMTKTTNDLWVMSAPVKGNLGTKYQPEYHSVYMLI